MSMDWIRSHYGVPAKLGGRVEYTRSEGSTDAPAMGTITGTDGQYLKVRLDGEKHTLPYHPTWQLRYLDGDSTPAEGGKADRPSEPSRDAAGAQTKDGRGPAGAAASPASGAPREAKP